MVTYLTCQPAIIGWSNFRGDKKLAENQEIWVLQTECISWVAGSCSGLPRWDCWPVWRPKLRTTSVLARQANLQDTAEVVASMWAGPHRHEGGRTWFALWFCEIVLEIAYNYSELRILLWSVSCASAGDCHHPPEGEGDGLQGQQATACCKLDPSKPCVVTTANTWPIIQRSVSGLLCDHRWVFGWVFRSLLKQSGMDLHFSNLSGKTNDNGGNVL